MWFQAAECNAVNANLKFNKQQLYDFLTENLPILNPCLPQKSENLRPHSSKSVENAKLLCDTPVQQLRGLFSMEGEFEQIITKIRLSIKENND